MKEGRQVGGEYGVREGRGVGGRELRRREGRREVGRLGQDRQGKQEGEEGGKDGREGDTNDQGHAWLCIEACQWLLAFTLYWHVGGRARRGPEKEAGTSYC